MDPLTVIAMLNAGLEIVRLAQKARDEVRRSGEWTPEQDRAFDAKLEAAFKQDHWQPRPVPTPDDGD